MSDPFLAKLKIHKKYTPLEIIRLHKEFCQETHLTDLEDIFLRPASSIIKKLSQLSKEEPEKWEPPRLNQYRKQFYTLYKDEILISKKAEEKRLRKREYKKLKKEQQPYKEFGIFLKQGLYRLNKSQYWLSKEIGVTRQAISLYILGINIPTIEKRKSIAKILNIDYKTIEDLI